MTQGALSAPPSANVTSPADSTRSTKGSEGATGTRLSQYQESKLVHRVLRGMEQLANGGGQVRMRLHPPELGSLQLSLRIEGTTVFAEMQVETTSARDTLMKNLPILKDRLAEQGMQIQQFDVRADGNFDGGNFNASSRSGYGGGDSNSDRRSSRYVAELQNRLPDTSGATAADLVRRWTRTHGMLDFEA
jgi:flagellar hook-length control protein FliK